MTFTTRLGLFLTIAIAGLIAWQWNAALDGSQDVTQLAVRQFHNDAAVPGQLAQASLAQQWWPLAWPLVLAMLGAVMFWDDLVRLWKMRESA